MASGREPKVLVERHVARVLGLKARLESDSATRMPPRSEGTMRSTSGRPKRRSRVKGERAVAGCRRSRFYIRNHGTPKPLTP